MTKLDSLVRRLARGGAAAPPPAAELRGRGPEWARAERQLLPDCARSSRRGERLAAIFETLARRCGENEARGRAARLTGSFLSLHGRYRESSLAYRRAIRFLRGAARDGARIGLAGSLLRLGRFGESAELARAARRAARRRGDDVIAAAAALNLGTALHEGGDPARALRAYRAAHAEAAAAGDTVLAARAAGNLANALVLLDRYEEAEPLYAGAARDLQRCGSGREAARFLYNRGALLVATGRLGEADETLRRAEAELRAVGAPQLAALARLDRGEALLRARLVPEARHAIGTARREMQGGVPLAERARATLLAARAALAAGDARATSALLSRPLPQETSALRADRTELRGRAAALRGRHAVARDLLLDAARRHGRTRPVGACRARTAAAWCALREHDLSGARSLSRAALHQAQRLGLSGLVHAAAATLFLVERGSDRAEAAQVALRTALEALEEVRAGLGSEELTRAVLREREAWFAAAVRHVLEHEGSAPALALVERWRARSLVDLLAVASGVSPAGDDLEMLRARVAVLERRLQEETLPAFLRGAGSAGSHAALRRAERELATATRLRAPALAGAPLDLEGFSAALPAGTVVVSLFADEEGGLAFVLRDGLKLVGGLPNDGDVAAEVEELHFLLGRFALGPDVVARHRRRLRAGTERVLARLASRLLDPLDAALRDARRVVVVPHGAWHAVPFAALPWRGRPLAARVAVSLAPALAALRPSVPMARGRAVVVACSDGRAPHIADEARQVARVHPGALLLTDTDATGDALLARRRLRGAPRCLHIAAHGRFRSDAPAMSGVRLEDGWLTAADFRRLRLAGSLVVVSGCDTGTSHVGAGGEVEGLVRGALAAGARDVVLGGWRVPDRATAQLMGRFHRLYCTGLAPDAALARAQTEMAQRGRHPWYWAGFSVWTRRLR